MLDLLLLEIDFYQIFVTTTQYLSDNRRVYYLFFFFLGSFLTAFIPKEIIRYHIENYLFTIVYNKIQGYNVFTIKRRKKELEAVLIKLAEVFSINGVNHLGLWFIYRDWGKGGRRTGSLVYEYNTSSHLVPLKKLYREFVYEGDPKIEALWNWVLTPDFPGHFVYKNEGGSLLENVTSKHFAYTVILPKADLIAKTIPYMITIDFISPLKDQHGNDIEIVLSETQKKRTRELLHEVHTILVSY